MDNGFKPCELIELHAPGGTTIIHPRNYSDALAGWTEFLEEGETFSISGDQLSRLARHLKIKPGLVLRDGRDADGSCRVREELENYDFPLLKRTRQEVGSKRDGRWIESLQARIVAPNQLEMLVRWGFDGEDGAELDEVRIAYCGSFSVWWSPESIQDSAAVPAA